MKLDINGIKISIPKNMLDCKHSFKASICGLPEPCKCGMTYQVSCLIPVPEPVQEVFEVESTHYVPNLTEFFNRGLGCYTSGTRDAEKKAKKMGLIPVGGEKVEKFIPKDDSSKKIDKILDEGMRRIHRS